MAETAYIYDAIRTPRSRGKADGSLNEVKPINLVTTLLDEMQQRHDGFDILLICPPPVLEAGVLADMFAGGRAKSLQLPKPYAEVAKIRELAILNAGDFIESSPLDGVHFEADMHRKLGKAVAKAVLKMAG